MSWILLDGCHEDGNSFLRGMLSIELDEFSNGGFTEESLGNSGHNELFCFV